MTDNLRAELETLLERENRLFKQDYESHFLEGETKPKYIGEPFLLENAGTEIGILLVHGLMAAPEEVREWATFLHSKGYTVYAPRLSGHGTSADDLSQRRYTDWLDSIDRGLEILKCCCSRIVIGGFSTGAGLALLKATQEQEAFDAVIAVSAPFRFKSFAARLTEMVQVWNRFVQGVWLSRFAKPFARNHPDNPHINYHRCPINGLVEVRRMMRRVSKKLPELRIPALIIQGSNDPKVDPASGRKIYEKLNAENARYHEVDYHLHGIVRGEIADEVFTASEEFLNGVFQKKSN